MTVSLRPKTVLVINNNPNCAPGKYTQLLISHLEKASLQVHEARTVQAVDELADKVSDETDIGLIITCGSSVVLTDPVDIEAHLTKTTAALLHFPNAPVVGICYGLQMLAVLYGGKLESQWGHGHQPGHWEDMKRAEVPSRFFEGIPETFVQWATNQIFLKTVPPRFVVTALDSSGRVMAIEHTSEHLYGVQFHPEMLHEPGLNLQLIDKMVSLVGQNRRASVGIRSTANSSRPWQCSTQCRLRRAVKEARSLEEDGGCDGCSGRAADLAERLNSAKRRALVRLQRDHCREGGITVRALQDAIEALRCLASGTSEKGFAEEDSPRFTAAPRTVEHEDDSSIPSEATCSPHDADLRLRLAVKEALMAAHPTTVRSSCYDSNQSTRATSSASDASVWGSASRHEELNDLPKQDALVAVAATRCTVHEADLRLRKAVRDALAQAADCDTAEMGRALASARKQALMELRGKRPAVEGIDATELEASVNTLLALKL